GEAAKDAVSLREGLVEASIPLVLSLHPEIVYEQVIYHARKVRQREYLQQVLRDLIDPVRGYDVAGKKLPHVGGCDVGGWVVDPGRRGAGGDRGVVAGPHLRGRLAGDRGA